MGLGLILLYNFILTVGLVFLSPLLLLYLSATTKRRRTFRGRMGWCRHPWPGTDRQAKSRRIWVHALSVGEMQSIHPLVLKLCRLNPDAAVYVTASTYTGFQTAKSLFKHQAVHLSYFPYDTIWSVRKVANRIAPTHVIITETDIWPNFLWEMKRHNVPVYLVNLRISDRSWSRFLRFRRVAGKVFAVFDRLCVQTEKEMVRLRSLEIDANRICVTGNLKFDSIQITPATDPVAQWRSRMKTSPGHRWVVAGSTHTGEEATFLEALKPWLLKDSNLSIMIVPRDPNRSTAVMSLCQNYGLRGGLWSHMIGSHGVKACPQVVVVDTLGDLKALYGLADIAFVGGSLVPLGGHNPLEPALWSKPILFGSDMRDFEQIAGYLLSAGAAIEIRSGDHLRSVMDDLLLHPAKREEMGTRALMVYQSHQGAVDRSLAFLNLC